jgi:Fe-S-cluster-containing dehydrogenase component
MLKTQYAMVIDSSKCFNCKACVIACQLANGVPSGLYRNWIKQAADEDGGKEHFQPGNCMHCDNPTCVRACPTSATYKDEKDGTVKINLGLCINCGSCVPACPYGARFNHPEKLVVDKCNFCEERRARGEPVACVYVCPTQARSFGNILDPKSDVARLLKKNKTVRVINAKVDTEPNIYYISSTAPMNWPVEPMDPAPIQLWKNLADPIVRGLVGLTGLGVLVMLGKQLLLEDKPPDSEDGKKEA